jgi:hypothetical protein
MTPSDVQHHASRCRSTGCQKGHVRAMSYLLASTVAGILGAGLGAALAFVQR